MLSAEKYHCALGHHWEWVCQDSWQVEWPELRSSPTRCRTIFHLHINWINSMLWLESNLQNSAGSANLHSFSLQLLYWLRSLPYHLQPLSQHLHVSFALPSQKVLKPLDKIISPPGCWTSTAAVWSWTTPSIIPRFRHKKTSVGSKDLAIKDSADVTTILVAFLQQFWLAVWALGLLIYLLADSDTEVQDRPELVWLHPVDPGPRSPADQNHSVWRVHF